MAKSYSVADILDKTLIVKTNTNARSYPSLNAPILRVFKTGEVAGVPYSYVTRDGVIWFMFDDVLTKKPYYISSAAISGFNLQEQGVKTTEEKAKEEEEKKAIQNRDIFDRIFDVIINVALLVLAAYLLNSIIQKKL
jgi:hypothetical protein